MHGKIVGTIIGYWALVCLLVGVPLQWSWRFTQGIAPEYIAISAILFVGVFWCMYFSCASRFPSLRSFLRSTSILRGKNPYEIENHGSLGDHITKKSGSYMATVGLFMAVTTFLLGSVLQMNTDEAKDGFHVVMRHLILLIGVLDILVFVFAVDMLDTAMNPFIGSRDDIGGLKPKIWFYRHAGPRFPAGGGEHAFFGYSIFTILVIMSVAYVAPVITPFVVGVFAYLGYPFLFGYKYGQDEQGATIEIDEEKKSGRLAVGFLAGFILLGFLSVYIEFYAKG